MFTSILIATGGAFVATVAVGTVSAVITKIRNNRKNKVTSPTPPAPTPKKKVRTNTLDREQTLEKLQEKIDAVNMDSARIDDLIAKKVNSLKLNPNTQEHKTVLAKAMKSRWEDTSRKYIAQVQRVMENLKDNDNFEEVLAKVPTLASAETFVEKCENSLIPAVSEKYAYYVSEKEKIDLSELDVKDKNNRTSKVYAARDVVDALFSKIENMILNDTKVADFKASANADFKTISNEVETVKEFKKVKKNLQNAIEATKALEKNKASKADVETAVKDLAKQIADNKAQLDLIDLKPLSEAIKGLQDKFGKYDETLAKKLTAFEASVGKMVEAKIAEAVKGKVDAKDLSKHIEDVKTVLAEYEKKLSSTDLASLDKKVAELTKAYEDVYGQISATVKKEVDAMKASINKGLAVRIGNVLKKKLADFDEKHRTEIINIAIVEFKNIAVSTVGNAMTEDEVIDKVIDAINERYTLSKKTK